MSRAYTIRVSESIRKHVRVEDGVQTRLDILAVLSEAEMAELLAAELLALGFEREGEALVRNDEDGVEVSVDANTATVTVRQAASADVAHTIERSARVEEEVLERGKQRLHRQVASELEDVVEDERARLTEELAVSLEAKLRNLRRELDSAGTRATAEALKVRAAQLGEIQEVSENGETGELTIKVKV